MSETDRFDDDTYGYINEQPHIYLSMPFNEWHHALQDALAYKVGPPIAWRQEDGDVWLWGEHLDEQTVAQLLSAIQEIERDYGNSGQYEAAQYCQRARSRLRDAEIKSADEEAVC